MNGTTLTLPRHDERLRAVQPDARLVTAHAAQLCAWYNNMENAQMMGAGSTMTEADVRDFWADLDASGARGFLCFVGDRLVGDMDLRGKLSDGYAEFAIMVGDTRDKGQGLGLAFATMIHVFAFRELGLHRIYVTPKRENQRVQRLNRRLGYVPDASERARSFLDEGDTESESQSVGPDELRAAIGADWQSVVCTNPGAHVEPRVSTP
jgi:RimJ/RimL family protein N-acetyltransferase